MNRFIIVTMAVALNAMACSLLTPNYERPKLDLPEHWEKESRTPDSSQDHLQNWWKKFNDPVLEKLIDQSLADNDDLAKAGAKVQQAKAYYEYTSSNRMPLLTILGGAAHSKADFERNLLLSDTPSDVSFIGGMLSYEIDLWGKLASANESARAKLQSARYGRDLAALSVSSAVARMYFDILALDRSIQITQEILANRKEAHQLVVKLYEHQAANALTLSQSEAELSGIVALLPKLKEQRDRAESSLAVLLGYSPKEILESAIPRGAHVDMLPVLPVFPSDVPSSLLERRPDVAAAEQSLIASNCDIAVARAAYFPSISLTSLFGVAHLDIANIYNGTVPGWQIGSTLAGPVLDFGRTRSGLSLTEAKNQEAVAAYKQAVRNAFMEVKQALSAQANTADAEKARGVGVESLQEVVRLAGIRTASGYSSSLEVLDAERNLLQARTSLVTAKLDRLHAAVALYKALGGGWEEKDKN